MLDFLFVVKSNIFLNLRRRLKQLYLMYYKYFLKKIPSHLMLNMFSYTPCRDTAISLRFQPPMCMPYRPSRLTVVCKRGSAETQAYSINKSRKLVINLIRIYKYTVELAYHLSIYVFQYHIRLKILPARSIC